MKAYSRERESTDSWLYKPEGHEKKKHFLATAAAAAAAALYTGKGIPAFISLLEQ